MDSTPLGTPDAPDFRQKAKDAYSKLKEAKNGMRTIQFVMSGFKKLRSHSGDSRTLRIVPGLKGLMENAVWLYEEKDRTGDSNVKAWHTYASRAVLDGEPVFVKLVVREESNGKNTLDLFDDSSVTVEKAARTPAFNAGAGDLSKDKLHAWWHSVNPDSVFKAVDENGEPIVVHHGTTDRTFTAFDPNKVESEDGFFFTTHRAGAEE